METHLARPRSGCDRAQPQAERSMLDFLTDPEEPYAVDLTDSEVFPQGDGVSAEDMKEMMQYSF